MREKGIGDFGKTEIERGERDREVREEKKWEKEKGKGRGKRVFNTTGLSSGSSLS